MDLDGQFVLRVDELDEQGERLQRRALPAEGLLADRVQVLPEGQAAVPPGRDHTVAVRMRRELPALGDRVPVTLLMVQIPELRAAPEVVLVGRGQADHRIRPQAQVLFRQVPLRIPAHIAGVPDLAHIRLDHPQGTRADVRDLVRHLRGDRDRMLPGEGNLRLVHRHLRCPLQQGPVLTALFMGVFVDGLPGQDHDAADGVILAGRQEIIVPPGAVDGPALLHVVIQGGIVPQDPLQVCRTAFSSYIYRVAGVHHQDVVEAVDHDRLVRRAVDNFRAFRVLRDDRPLRDDPGLLQVLQAPDILPGKPDRDPGAGFRRLNDPVLDGHGPDGFEGLFIVAHALRHRDAFGVPDLFPGFRPQRLQLVEQRPALEQQHTQVLVKGPAFELFCPGIVRLFDECLRVFGEIAEAGIRRFSRLPEERDLSFPGKLLGFQDRVLVIQPLAVSGIHQVIRRHDEHELGRLQPPAPQGDRRQGLPRLLLEHAAVRHPLERFHLVRDDRAVGAVGHDDELIAKGHVPRHGLLEDRMILLYIDELLREVHARQRPQPLPATPCQDQTLHVSPPGTKGTVLFVPFYQISSVDSLKTNGSIGSSSSQRNKRDGSFCSAESVTLIPLRVR